MNRHCFLVLVTLFLVYATPSFGQTLFCISSNGKPELAIVVGANATLAEKTAAEELSRYLGKITDLSFPVYKSGASPAGLPRILIGQTVETKGLLGNIDWKDLKTDGIVLRFVGKDLILAGDRPRGSLYAVYTFLEDYTGCKWWTPNAAYVPHKPRLSVKKKDTTHIPPFIYREAYFTQVANKNPEFAAKLKLNGTGQTIPEEFGGHYTLLGFVHTFDNNFMPAAGYFSEHPEWFSLVSGKRVGGQGAGQLCLTNEEMKAEFVKNVMKTIDAEPEAGMIAIDQNDNFNYCQCEKCSAIAKEEGGQSGVLLRFVNSVADEIAKKYPDFLVETLAYQYTRKAPKITKPRDNVIIRLCTIECDFASPLTSRKNTAFYNDLQNWKKIAKHLYIWDYLVNFQNLSLTYPNWHIMDTNMRIYADSKVVGMFAQGDVYNSDSSFLHMKTWVLSKLMWNPTLDSRQLMKEFATGYYGRAAPYLLAYLDLVCDAIDDSNTLQLSCFAGDYLDYMDQKAMDKSTELFDRAERAVSTDPVLLKRVKIERLSLDMAWILQTQLDRSKAGKSRQIDMPAIAENYIAVSQATGNDYIKEGVRMSEDFFDSLRTMSREQPISLPKPPAPKKKVAQPERVRQLKKGQWIDVQDSRMFLYRPGLNTFVVADDNASDGRAVRLPGEQAEWAAQVRLDKLGVKPGDKVSIYVTVRARLKSESGLAFTIGMIDVLGNTFVSKKDMNIEDIENSNYHDYYFGTFTVEPKWYVFVAAPGDNKLVSEVLVDRFFIIKEN